MSDLKPCPFGADHKVWIGVHDDEGNYHGAIGCEYESDPWSGLSYGLHHEGWGDCPLCTDDESETMGGTLFDTPEEATEAWNTRAERTCRVVSHSVFCGSFGCEEAGETWELSCGHEVMTESGCDHPEYCIECGTKVVEP